MDPTQWDAPFPVVVAALFVVVMLRANATFWLGRLSLVGLRRFGLARLLDSPGYLRASERISRYGAPVVTLSFLTVGFQTLANLAAGTTGMKLRHYLPAVAIGGVFWALIYATVGFVGVELFGRLYAYSPPVAVGCLILVIAIIAGYVAWQFIHRGAPATEAVAEPAA